MWLFEERVGLGNRDSVYFWPFCHPLLLSSFAKAIQLMMPSRQHISIWSHDGHKEIPLWSSWVLLFTAGEGYVARKLDRFSWSYSVYVMGSTIFLIFT